MAETSADAALLVTLAPGNYTAMVSGLDGVGIALIELYGLSPLAAGQKLLNIAMRAQIGRNEDVCIAGFVVAGTVPKRSLVRGIGPALAAFLVPGALVDPQFVLFRDSAPVATNDDWSGQTTIDAAASVGAFALGDCF